MDYVAIQIGARRNYAVPALLERAGMLRHFYTDICSDVGIGRVLSRGGTLPLVGAKLRRLSGRRLPAGVAGKTTTFAGPLLSHMVRSPFAKSAGESFRAHVRWTDALGTEIAKKGFNGATHLYSMLGECAPAISAAKRRGLRVVTEIYILLSADRIVAEERRSFPGWESHSPDYDAIRREMRAEFAMLDNTDIAICPAESVSDDLARHYGFPKERSVIVPYGVDPEWLEIQNEPTPGRILFAGSACLRKGIHYLAMAADRVSRRGIRCEFRVAGDVTPEIANRPDCRHLKFLGRIPRQLIRGEFERSDLFVLPTLAEGSAEVIYQALAAGVPVVTTAEAGSVVRHGLEGLIVPGRNPELLAEAIAELVEDRARRERYAAAAKRRALDFIWSRYSDRLLAALKAL